MEVEGRFLKRHRGARPREPSLLHVRFDNPSISETGKANAVFRSLCAARPFAGPAVSAWCNLGERLNPEALRLLERYFSEARASVEPYRGVEKFIGDAAMADLAPTAHEN
jgi:hypothetical protein